MTGLPIETDSGYFKDMSPLQFSLIALNYLFARNFRFHQDNIMSSLKLSSPWYNYNLDIYSVWFMIWR